MPKELGMKSVGWLDKDHTFETGDVDSDIIDKLESMESSVQHMGHHNCPFCGGGFDSARSSNEIWVVSKEGKIYACPRMIIHYIRDHKYLPPQEFLDAVKYGYDFKDPISRELTKNMMDKLRELRKRKY